MNRNLELDRSSGLARELDAIDFEEHLRSLKGVDEAHELEVVSRKTSLNFNRDDTGGFRIFLLISGLLHADAVGGSDFSDFIEQVGILGGKAVLIEASNFFFRQHDLLVHAAQRFDSPVFLG